MTDSIPHPPPNSDVDDALFVQQINKRPLTRPRSVEIAFGMLLCTQILNLFNVLYTNKDGSIGLAGIIFSALIVLTFAIRSGMNWARILFLILFLALSFIGMLPFFIVPGLFSHLSTASLAIIAIQTFLPVASFWLIFRKPGSLWFKRTHS